MNDDHFIQIYNRAAPDYQRMIAAEDVEGNLLPALQAITDIRNRRVLDLGSGTGRLPLLLSSLASDVVGIDLHRPMLEESRRQRGRSGERWSVLQADIQSLPLASGWADVVTAGWAIGHFCSWYGRQWKERVRTVLLEMERVARPSGTLIILETLGTGRTTPAPPTPALAQYYRYLEANCGFRRRQIRTDYQFASVEEALLCTEFFFGAELAQSIRDRNWSRVPEWTGVWSRPAATASTAN